ncbi:unannotated protein [freshwater metagenome]|uniref:Unannotated protein n=1 Tax=freshwater metagenome TaxID=449393 RepID=A0A6J7GHX4_9ZZZZ
MTRPRLGSSSSNSINASATLARIGATWYRSIVVGGFGCTARINARCNLTGVTPSSKSGINSAKRSSGPAIRAKLKPAFSTSSLKTPATSLKVLQSNKRASNKSRSSHSASSSSRSISALPGSNLRVFNSTRVAAISKNSVAISMSKVCMR